jgi:hypothetical protein
LELLRYLFKFIQNRLFCWVTRLLYLGHPTTYRTASGRPTVRAGTPEKKNVLTPRCAGRFPLPRALCASRMPSWRQRAVRLSPKTSQAPLLPLAFILPPSPRFFLQRAGPCGSASCFSPERAQAGQAWPPRVSSSSFFFSP